MSILKSSLAGLCFGLIVAACADAELQATQGEAPPPVDNRLDLTGEICTEAPGDELFPVKVMVVVDTSNSLQFTDMVGQRVIAVQQLLDRYAQNPAVEFSVIAFDAIVSDLTGGFTNNPDISAISTRLNNADRLTDYQGVLSAINNTLSADMQASSPAERARTKYVVVFFSDGSPDPRCEAGVPPPPPNAAGVQFVCFVDRDDWPSTFTLPGGINPNTGQNWTWEDFTGLYPELDAGKDYNTDEQILLKVEQITELQEIYNVNELRFHTAFLFDPTLPQATLDAFQLDRVRSGTLLQSMADTGGGTFTEFSSGGEISFLNVNYASAKQVYAMTNLIVSNKSAVPMADADPKELGTLADSDGDGLPDIIEDQLRLCGYASGGAACNPGGGAPLRDPLDTDGDGYTDYFEYRLRSFGFDPLVSSDLTAPCDARDDTDGDGLRDCEELYLGSNARLPDHDGDRIPDGIEFRFGLDPVLRDDAVQDNDADGTLNGEEILRHWDPIRKEPLELIPPEYSYKIESLGETPDGRNCYRFEVENIRLKTTRGFDADARGLNEIELFFLEAPPDDPRDFGFMRKACVHARFIEPDLKLPANGRVELVESDFFDPTDPALECVPPTRRRNDSGDMEP